MRVEMLICVVNALLNEDFAFVGNQINKRNHLGIHCFCETIEANVLHTRREHENTLQSSVWNRLEFVCVL